jgi:hypothetical protein
MGKNKSETKNVNLKKLARVNANEDRKQANVVALRELGLTAYSERPSKALRRSKRANLTQNTSVRWDTPKKLTARERAQLQSKK